METELEKTYLLKQVPLNLKQCKMVEIRDVYIPLAIVHPTLRIRKRGNTCEITKKEPLVEGDASVQIEHTIPLSNEEFEALKCVEGKMLRKLRYYYPLGPERVAEIDVYLDHMEGLMTADVEFANEEEKARFEKPAFCLAEVTHEEWVAAGMLAGKAFQDIEPLAERFGYKKLTLSAA